MRKELLVLLAGVVVVLISLGLHNFAILDDVEVDTYAKLEGKKWGPVFTRARYSFIDDL